MYVYFSMTENQLLALTRQYGSKAEALKNMPEVELQLNDKSIYGEKGRIETISGVVDRNTGTASCVPYSRIRMGCCIAEHREM